MTAASEGGASLEREADDPVLELEPTAGELPEGEFPEEEYPEGELPEAERPVRLRVAPKISRSVAWRRRRARLLVFGVAALSAASMFLLVAFHVFAAQSAFQLDKLDTQLTKEQREYEHLRANVATLSSPDAVASGAAKLHMVRSPEVTQLVAPTSVAFGANPGLPVPPAKVYDAIAAGP